MGSQPSVRETPGAHLRLVAIPTVPPDDPIAVARQVAAARDGVLVDAFEKGAPGAGAELYDRLLPTVDATIYRILGRRESDHADLVQSAFEQIVVTLARRSFARDCSLTGWAAAIACHVGLNALRSRKRERNVIDRRQTPGEADAPEPAAPTHLEAQLRAREALEIVRRALADMDPGRVTAVLLNAMGYELTDIARSTGVSVAAAQSRLSRGRRELRARIEDPAVRSAAEDTRTRP
jgi:RNA polymerase sigma-70 factor (ECF subfamily)